MRELQLKILDILSHGHAVDVDSIYDDLHGSYLIYEIEAALTLFLTMVEFMR